MSGYYSDLGVSGKTKAARSKSVQLHPVAKANIAAVQGQAAAEAALAATRARIRLFAILGLVAVGGGVWFYMKKRKVKS